MAKIPYFPFYPDDYLSSPGVTTCELLDEGIYIRLLAYSWKHPGCQLPDDLKYLQRLCKGVRKHVIQRVLDRHFERIELVHSVFIWRNARLHFEFTRALLRSEHGEKGANSRWDKEKQNARAMPEQCPDDAYQNQNQNQNHITPKVKRKDRPAQAPFALPEWMPSESWTGYEEMRKKKKAPMTDRARNLIIKSLIALKEKGYDPGSVLDQSTEKSWTGVFPLKGDNNAGSQNGGGERSGVRNFAEERAKQRADRNARILARGTDVSRKHDGP